MITVYPLLKSLHIIFIVTWFAGLFYISRILIYQTEANHQKEPDKSILISHTKKTARRLWYGITWPSAIISLFLGAGLFVYWMDGIALWLWLKLVFVAFLYAYHFATHKIFLKLQRDTYPMSSTGLRIWNEVPTVILFAVVFLVIFKNAISIAYGLGGLLILIGAILLGIHGYKRFRKERESQL